MHVKIAFLLAAIATCIVPMLGANAAVAAKLLAPNPVLLEGMNHVLKIATLEPASQNLAYTDPKLPIAPSLIDAIVAFMKPCMRFSKRCPTRPAAKFYAVCGSATTRRANWRSCS